MSFSVDECTAWPTSPSIRSIEWEETNCLLCGSGRWAIVIEAPDSLARDEPMWFAVVACRDCGLCFTNPRPGPASIAQFYPAEYFPARAPTPREREQRSLRICPRWPWRYGRKRLKLRGEGRLLDFGCGGGAFLQRMSRQGWQVTGLDVCSEVAARASAELGLRVLAGTLPHRELERKSFDVITMWHSLEHVHEPLEVLRHARELLVPGGRLLIEVPSICSLPFAWFGRNWYGLDLPRHLTHFSPTTLKWMVQRSGLRVRNVRMVRRSSWMRRSATGMCQKASYSVWIRSLRTKLGSRVASAYCSALRASDCVYLTAERAA